MKVNELRIGNWIDFRSTPGEIEQVMSITNGNVNNVNIDDIQPIPLTEEWFIKLGFNYRYPFEDSDSFVFQIITNKGERITFGYVSDEIGWCSDRLLITIETHYVHQLQNLYFALTGEELELK